MEKRKLSALPPATSEYLKAQRNSGLLRSFGSWVLGRLLPERQKTEYARTSTPQTSSESVDNIRPLAGGDVAHETTDEIEEESGVGSGRIDDEVTYDVGETPREVSLEEEERLFRELREIYLRSRPRKRLTAYQFVTSGDFAPEMPRITRPNRAAGKDQ